MHSLFGMGSQIFRGDPGIWDLEIPKFPGMLKGLLLLHPNCENEISGNAKATYDFAFLGSKPGPSSGILEDPGIPGKAHGHV